MLTPVTLLLKANKVNCVKITYAGGGDSGSIEEVSFVVAGKPKDILGYDDLGISKEQMDNLERIVYDLLEVRGWNVNNEGSSGHIIWDLKRDSMMHEHTYHEYGECEIEHDHGSGDECDLSIVDGDGYQHDGVEDLVGRIQP